MLWKWLLAATLAAAQPPPGLNTQIQHFRYPPLARQARIQGSVRLAKNNGAVTVFSGHPILIPTAFQATESFPPIPSHDTITNKFEPSLRRLLHLKTEKAMYESHCEQPAPRPNKLTITGPHIEIWVAATHACLQVQTASNKPVSHTHFPSAAPHS